MKSLFLLLLALSFPALADERRMLPIKPSEEWKLECGSCHMAFPPGLLPAASWRKMMANLDKHFGTDASLNARETREITDFLVANAGSRWRLGTPERITEDAHFKREHRRITADVLKRPAIRSITNCVACHTAAAQGDFEEDRIRIPH